MTDFIQLIKDVQDQYHRMILVNEENSEKYKKYCKSNNIPLINLSAKLAELLSDLSEEERSMEAWDILKDWMRGLEEPILAFEEIDYLFSPELGLDPIKNFGYYSRDKQVIILFMRARKRNNLLIYSEEGNDDYREMDISSNEGFVIGW